MFCGKCGVKNADDATVCTGCGARLHTNQKVPVNTENRILTHEQRGGAEQKHPISTTRKTSKKYLIGKLIEDACYVGISIFLFIRADKLIDSYWYRSDGENVLKAGFILLFIGALSLIYHAMVSTTYVDLFEDRIVGTGMQKIQIKSFSLRFDQICGISVSKGFLNVESGSGVFLVINTLAGDYKVITTAKYANEIAEYYSRVAD